MESIYRQDFATRRQSRTEIFDYIESFYNRQRAHRVGAIFLPFTLNP